MPVLKTLNHLFKYNTLKYRGRSWHLENSGKTQIYTFLQYQWEQKCSAGQLPCKEENILSTSHHKLVADNITLK